MPNFFDKGLGTEYAGGSYVDPAGLFAEGGMFGPGDASAQKAQAEFLQRMMGREGDLYPELKQKLTDAGLLNDQALKAMQDGTGPAYDNAMQTLKQVASLAPQAFQAATGEANKLYPGVQADINTAGKNAENFTLPPAALDALNKIREQRISSIGNDVNNLVGSKISDYARRGVLSSSTAEGMGGEVGKAIAPTINQAEQDYQQQLLQLPTQLYQLAKDRGLTTYGLGVNQGNLNATALKDLATSQSGNAMNQYGLAAGQSTLKSTALKDKSSSLLDPYLQMWKTSSGVGATNPAVDPNAGKSAENLGAIAKIVGSFA